MTTQEVRLPAWRWQQLLRELRKAGNVNADRLVNLIKDELETK
jgi:hypothetical protein